MATPAKTMCRFSMRPPLIDQVGQRPPYPPIARAELQTMLMHAYGPPDQINFGCKMVSVHDGPPDAATARFADGTTVSADVIIGGADGAGSITRDYVLGGAPVSRRYAGYVNFNGLVETDDAIGPATEWTTYVADGKRVSVMPVAGGRFYFFFDVVEPPGVPYEKKGSARDVLRAHFAGWAAGGVQALIDKLDPATTNRVEIFFDVDPFHTWSKAGSRCWATPPTTPPPDIGQGGAARRWRTRSPCSGRSETTPMTYPRH